jgi:tripartite-type tricarboxylate transporter receptor subunit TctC
VLIIVDMASPYRTLDDLLTAARRNPGKISVAGGALGPPQIAFEMLKRAAKIDMRFMQVPNTTAAITKLALTCSFRHSAELIVIVWRDRLFHLLQILKP